MASGRFTDDLLAFFTNSWSSSFGDFGETFTVALDISNAFDRVWHKTLIPKLPSFGFYPSLCSYFLISNFLSDCYIAAVVDSHCSSSKLIKSGVTQGSVVSPTLFLLFINGLLNLTQCSIYSYTDDSTLHFSMSFSRRPYQKQVNNSNGDTTECRTEWSRENLVLFNASQTKFLHLSSRQLSPLLR